MSAGAPPESAASAGRRISIGALLGRGNLGKVAIPRNYVGRRVQTTQARARPAIGHAAGVRIGCANLAGMNRAMIFFGVVLVVIGLFWQQLKGLPLFRLPGDFVIDKPGFKFFFPITTMLIVSVVVSVILWLFRR